MPILKLSWMLPSTLALMLTMMLSMTSSSAARAQEAPIMPGKIIQWGDYDQFQVAGPGGPRTCAETCAHDPRCKAWTYIRPVNQCRLKHDVGHIADNPCCVSGVKPAELADSGGKQGFCADYARAAIAANAQNESQGCRLDGPRWSDDFQAHYTWCMGTRRDDVNVETQARAAGIAQCQQTANSDAAAKCDHFARISMVQIDTARKARCPLPQGDRRWAGDAEDQRRACLQAPARMLEHTIAAREVALTSCLAAAGQAQEVCGGYADSALEQVRAASNAGCDVSGPSWSTSRAEHLQFCFKADPAARTSAAADRTRQLAACTQQAAKQQICDQYAETATQQAVRAGNENCGFNGPQWSRYKDEHIAFCMQAGAPQLRSAVADREAAGLHPLRLRDGHGDHRLSAQ